MGGKKRRASRGQPFAVWGIMSHRKEGGAPWLPGSFSNAPQGLQYRRAPTLYSLLWRPPMSRNSQRRLAVYPTLNLVLFPNSTLFSRKEGMKAEGKGT